MTGCIRNSLTQAVGSAGQQKNGDSAQSETMAGPVTVVLAPLLAVTVARAPVIFSSNFQRQCGRIIAAGGR